MTLYETEANKATLEGILRQSTVKARTCIRAKIVLLKEYIADKLDICVTAVRLCIDKYNAKGIEATLRDNKGRERKAKITDAEITWVINKPAINRKILGIWLNYGILRVLHALLIQQRSRKGIPT